MHVWMECQGLLVHNKLYMTTHHPPSGTPHTLHTPHLCCPHALPYHTPLPHNTHTHLRTPCILSTGGKDGYWHTVPARIAVNMIICCASGGTLAVLVASWMQVSTIAHTSCFSNISTKLLDAHSPVAPLTHHGHVQYRTHTHAHTHHAHTHTHTHACARAHTTHTHTPMLIAKLCEYEFLPSVL